jgi:hypothetical protein
MQKQYEIDLENRDQIIASLRRKIAEKDEEINVNSILKSFISIDEIFLFVEIT